MNAQYQTTRDVSVSLRKIGFDVVGETLAAISRNCRDVFLEHLTLCSNENDSQGKSQEYIGMLLRCLSPEKVRQLQTLCPASTIDCMAKVAHQKPKRLLSAIDAACNTQHAQHNEAKSWLNATFCPQTQNPQPPPAPAPLKPHTPRSGDTKPSSALSTKNADNEQMPSNKYQSAHVYGANYALCFNAKARDGEYGIMVDAATQLALKSYDWANALHLWLNKNEVAAVLAVLRRWRSQVVFSNHGKQNDKEFSIEFQGKHFFTKLWSKKLKEHGARAVKIMPTDATAVSVLFLSTLRDNYPTIPLSQLLEVVRSTQEIENDRAV